MKFTPKNVRKFQEGGPVEQAPMPEEQMQEAPAQEEQNPLLILAEGAAQALQAQDCNMMAQVCEGLISLVQQAANAAPAQREPVFRKGGVLVKRIKK